MMRGIKSVFTSMLDFVLPPRCFACLSYVEMPNTLCVKCWQGLKFHRFPLCIKCGSNLPLLVDYICSNCVLEPPLFNQARSVFLYETDNISHRLVTLFKYSDKTFLTPLFASWMIRVGKDMLKETDYLIPIPLHHRRLFKRRYNQSALLANYIAKQMNVSILHNALLKTKATIPQVHLSKSKRQENLIGAFALNPSYFNLLTDKNITLIDDVRTTGATINESIKTLLPAKPRTINVLTLAHTEHK